MIPSFYNFLLSSSVICLFLPSSNGEQESIFNIINKCDDENIYNCFDCKFLVQKVKRWETLTSRRDYDNMNVRVRAMFNIKIIRNKIQLFHLLAIEFILYVLCNINTFKLVFTDINLPKVQIIRIINITKFTFFF